MYAAKLGKKKVVVKQVQNGGGDRKFQCLVQFHAEAILRATCNHPNIVQVLAMGKSGLLAMERADEDLCTWYENAGVVDWGTNSKSCIRQQLDCIICTNAA